MSERKEKIGVIGSRSITHQGYVWGILEQYSSSAACFLAGGAKGVDTLVEGYSFEKGIPFILFKPYFLLDPNAPYSVRHYFTRNKQIIDNSDRVVAIYDGDSPGTKWGIAYARKRGKTVDIYQGDLNEEVPDQS